MVWIHVKFEQQILLILFASILKKVLLSFDINFDILHMYAIYYRHISMTLAMFWKNSYMQSKSAEVHELYFEISDKLQKVDALAWIA